MENTKKSGFGKFVRDFKQFLPLLSNLVSKDFKIKYRRSFLGIAWSVLNPLFTMLVLTKVFSLLLRDAGSEDFATYYIIGYTMWAFFSESTVASLDSIIGASSLIKKVYIPKYVFPLEKCLFSVVNLCFSMIAVLAVIIYRSIRIGHLMLSAYSLLFPLPVLYCFLFACGVALFLSAVTVYFRDVAHLYTVLLTMWMYLTPIIYPVRLLEGEGHKLIKTIVMLNPMTHYVELFRDVLMRGSASSLNNHLICIGMALLSLLIGSLVFRKAQKKFILHI